MRTADSLEKTLMLGKIEGRGEKGMTEDKMVEWHHQLNGHEFEQALGDGKSQESLASLASNKELDMTQWLNNNRAEGRWGRSWEGCFLPGAEDSKTSSNVGALLVFNREDRDIATDSEVSGEYEESNPLEALAQMPPSKSCLSFPHQRPYLSPTDYYCWTLNFSEIQPLRP